MMRRLIFLAPIGVMVIVIVLLVLGLARDDGPNFRPSAMIGRPAPDLVLPGLDPMVGGLTLADHLGGKFVVNFFASWCVPCRAEHALLIRLAELPGVAVIGIAYKDKPADASRFLAELGNPFTTVGLDQDGRAAIAFGITGVPETFILDGKGVIVHHVAGPMTPELLDTEVLPAIAEAK